MLWERGWMPAKENALQLPAQFPSTSSSESELDTEYTIFKKRGKHHKENEVTSKVNDNHPINLLSNALHSCQSTPCHFCNYVTL